MLKPSYGSHFFSFLFFFLFFFSFGFVSSLLQPLEHDLVKFLIFILDIELGFILFSFCMPLEITSLDNPI